LKQLIKGDFEMLSNDGDFKITHEQLIKATKIILHKINLINKKNKYEQEESMKDLKKQYDKTEFNVESQMNEMKNFIHTLHHDFE